MVNKIINHHEFIDRMTNILEDPILDEAKVVADAEKELARAKDNKLRLHGTKTFTKIATILYFERDPNQDYIFIPDRPIKKPIRW